MLARQEDFLRAARRLDYASMREAVKETPEIVNAQPGYQQSALHIAASLANAAFVRWLLEHGASVWARDRDGKMPIDVVDVAQPQTGSHGQGVRDGRSRRECLELLQGAMRKETRAARLSNVEDWLG